MDKSAGWTANNSIMKLFVHVNMLWAVDVVIFVSNQEIKHESLKNRQAFARDAKTTQRRSS